MLHAQGMGTYHSDYARRLDYLNQFTPERLSKQMTWDTAPRKDIVDHIVEEVVGRPDFSFRNIPASFHYPASRIVDRDLA